MLNHLKSHFFEYLVLFLILSLGCLGFLIARGNKGIQFKVVLITSFLYVIWGIVHHFLEKTLYFKVMVEYVAVGLLAIVILGGLLL